MSIVNKTVKHQIFGAGKVVKVENGHIIVHFSEDKTFEYPKAFIAGFLEIDDQEVEEDIAAYLEEQKKIKEAAEAKRKTELEARMQEKRKEAERIQLMLQLKAKARMQEKCEETEHQKRRQPNAGQKTNYAFKLNYCNGGASKTCVGFCGACSDTSIQYHMEHGAENIWCRQPQCFCNQYYNGRITRAELDRIPSESRFLCYESRMLIDWIASAGINNSKGPKEGTARTIPGLQPYKLCVLTTVNPHEKGENRYVFGAFIIGESSEGISNGNEGFVKAIPGYTVAFTPAEAREIPFWSCYANFKNPDAKLWGSGLYRKFDDETALLFFEKMLEATQDGPNYSQVLKMKKFFMDHN